MKLTVIKPRFPLGVYNHRELSGFYQGGIELLIVVGTRQILRSVLSKTGNTAMLAGAGTAELPTPTESGTSLKIYELLLCILFSLIRFFPVLAGVSSVLQ